jgi:hypothetical protein
MKRLFLSSILALAFLAAPAFAGPICFKRDDFLKGTASTGTFVRVEGMSQNAAGAPVLIEVYENKDGDFLVVNTGLSGNTCVVATGVKLNIREKHVYGTNS